MTRSSPSSILQLDSWLVSETSESTELLLLCQELFLRPRLKLRSRLEGLLRPKFDTVGELDAILEAENRQQSYSLFLP